MRIVQVANVNQALATAVGMMLHEKDTWIEVAPRGRVTKEWPTPVATVYLRPWQRVLLSAQRDANPFFHLMEALWMLTGRRDAAWLSQFSSKIGQYAEEDGNFHGAYGWRWKHHFILPDRDQMEYTELDQLHGLVNQLRSDPTSRRAVLAMWDPEVDLGGDKKDLPCNTHAYFKVRDSRLNMLVSCRSNDLILGCYGANAVHFSVLQEYLAAKLGCGIGVYTHVSDSWHYYVDNPFALAVMRADPIDRPDYYQIGSASSQLRAVALVNGGADQWDRELEQFMSDDWHNPGDYKDLFFSRVAYYMRSAWNNYKRGDFDTALHLAGSIMSPDWRRACVEWLQRRQEKRDGNRTN